MGRRKKYQKTTEQINYCEQILGRTKKILKKVEVLEEIRKQEPTPDIVYVNNCFLWINKYFEGRCEKERYTLALKWLLKYAEKMPKIFMQNYYKQQ